MEADNDKTLRALTEAIEALKTKYSTLQEEHFLLKNQHKLLQARYEAETAKNESLRKEHDKVKMAKALVSAEDKGEAKRKINLIVREIDRCIALMNR